mmetsp:Transcript_21542/g.67575  ORF Transcript_21542/g.67575 Transcript_21542/m.67575 type:complete len:452 (+) Transcript_21542:1103-2458(+)
MRSTVSGSSSLSAGACWGFAASGSAAGSRRSPSSSSSFAAVGLAARLGGRNMRSSSSTVEKLALDSVSSSSVEALAAMGSSLTAAGAGRDLEAAAAAAAEGTEEKVIWFAGEAMLIDGNCCLWHLGHSWRTRAHQGLKRLGTEYSSLQRVQRYSARSGRHWMPTTAASSSAGGSAGASAGAGAAARPSSAGAGSMSSGLGGFGLVSRTRHVVVVVADEAASLSEVALTEGTSEATAFAVLARFDGLPERFRSDRRRCLSLRCSSPETTASPALARFRDFFDALAWMLSSPPESDISCESSVTTHAPRNGDDEETSCEASSSYPPPYPATMIMSSSTSTASSSRSSSAAAAASSAARHSPPSPRDAAASSPTSPDSLTPPSSSARDAASILLDSPPTASSTPLDDASPPAHRRPTASLRAANRMMILPPGPSSSLRESLESPKAKRKIIRRT